MAGYAFQIIPIKKFPSDGHFSCRYDLEDSALSQSVKKWGVLFPLIVTRKSYQLIAGHKRFYASLKLGQDLLPALEIQKVLSEGEAFIFSALSNWNQNWAEMDRVTTLSKAKNQYQVPSEELVEFWLPALGLPSERHFLDSYLQLAALHEDLKHLIHHQRLPFRGASLLLNFSQDDQKAFALHIGAKLKLTSNQLLKIAEWIKDLCVLKKTNIEKLLAETNLVKIGDGCGEDLRQKSEKFLNELERIRKPKLYEKRVRFQNVAGHFHSGQKDITLDLPEYFEGEGYTLKAHIRRREGVEGILKTLEERKSDLISLFDIMLGCP